MPINPVRTVEPELTLRILLVDPPPDVAFRVQRGRDGLVAPTSVSAERIAFEVRVRVVALDGGAITLRGDVAQGPPASRFVYVTCGTRAGQAGSPWDRRAKVPLTGITRALADEALARGAMLEGRIAGTDRCGAPACASVPLLDGWHVV